jgi:hypothetical protein
MTWGAIGGAAVSVIGGGLMGGGDSGGGGAGQTQTVSKDPWSVAAPWLTENVRTGQALQNHYQNNPFSQMQQLGYNNQSSNADYMRSLTSGVLGQLNNSSYFDRGNPNARPQAFQFPTTNGQAGGVGGGGSAYAGASQAQFAPANNPFANGAIPPPQPEAPAQVVAPVYRGIDPFDPYAGYSAGQYFGGSN